MFVQIETKGASHIVIAVPGDMAAKSLPMLAAMLEQNAVFVNKGYQSISIVKPEMTITLGQVIQVGDDSNGEVIKIVESGHVVGNEFELATPEVFVSNAKQKKYQEGRIADLNARLSLANSELAALKERVQELSAALDAI